VAVIVAVVDVVTVAERVALVVIAVALVVVALVVVALAEAALAPVAVAARVAKSPGRQDARSLASFSRGRADRTASGWLASWRARVEQKIWQRFG
jgi:hypothetical protein